jgi:ABC-type multidrug transport system fused ATPase/permease subunit
VQKMALRMRMDLLRHVDRLSADYHENTPPGAAMYPLQEPIDEVAYLGSELLPSILRMGLTVGITLTTMFVLSPVLSLAILPLLPVFVATRQHFCAKLRSHGDTVQCRLAAWSSFIEEHISAVLAIQLLGQETRQERKAFRLLARTAHSRFRLFQTGVYFTVLTTVAVVIAMTMVIGYGGWKVIVGTLSLGSLVAFYSFVTQLFEPLNGAAELYARAQRTFAGIRQLQAVWALRPTVTDSFLPVQFPKHDWGLEFTAVEFGYDGRKNVLRIPSLHIATGEKIVMVGENGSGKSTLARLLPRLYDVNSGSIQVGGTDIRNIQLQSLRRSICYLPRDPVMFDGTIVSSLRFVSPGASASELRAVIELADLAGLVATLPEGVHQRIGPDGCQLSGGFRQRLGIARVLLQKPRILILDEATSCLDPAAEALVLGNIRDHLSASTLIVVSHRASTLSAFERTLVIAAGSIVEDVCIEHRSAAGWAAKILSPQETTVLPNRTREFL